MRYDDWMDQERETRPRKKRPSFLTRLLMQLLLTVSSVLVVMWAYKQISTQAVQELTNISMQAQQKMREKAVKPEAQELSKHDEAIKQFQQQQKAELAMRQERREMAWRQFFTPSQECLRDATVECANAYIRAKRKFDEQYRD